MTDKQINKFSDLTFTQLFGYDLVATFNNNSKIKELQEQVKRKEQEYEELRQYHNKYCEEFEKEKKEWLEKYNQVSRDFYNGKYCNKENCNLLKAKEQECDMWKNLTIDNGAVALKYQQQLEAYKMEAEEGKEINAELKAENDELKYKAEFFENYNAAHINKITKLEQTLTDIKEIADKAEEQCAIPENYFKRNNVSWKQHQLKGLTCKFKQILQKISEVENG